MNLNGNVLEELPCENDYNRQNLSNTHIEEPMTSQSVDKKRIKRKTKLKKCKVDNETHKRKKQDKDKNKDPKGFEWLFLEHKGPFFAPEYKTLPGTVKFIYDNTELKLSPKAEEVAGFYAKMIEHPRTKKVTFRNNFFADWRRVMTNEERELITDFSKCKFTQLQDYFKRLSENILSKEEKAAVNAEKEKIQNEYGYCNIDGSKEKIANYKIEPPGLYIGRGNHPKMGKLKTRVMPEDMIINCSADSVIPIPPSGHNWKEVRHDNTVTWLASWVGNVLGKAKYVELHSSSELKQEKDLQKYETARKLHSYIVEIRKKYTEDIINGVDRHIRQRAVALYFIDKLALRAGNEKDEDQADTVGCCSLRVEHIKLHDKKDNKACVVVLDFLGKDSIKYYNEVPVDPHVFKNLTSFMVNKEPGDDLFETLDTKSLNEYLKVLMPDLTAKVFRTYNASTMLQKKLDEFSNVNATIEEKIKYYRQANYDVAVLCNHQCTVQKVDSNTTESLNGKINSKLTEVRNLEKANKICPTYKNRQQLDRLKKELKKLEDQLNRHENRKIALNTSRIHYMDPRITVAWCIKNNIDIIKIYTSKSLRRKFQWAIIKADANYVF